MRRDVLLDTGPLVAILSSRDQHYTECVEALRAIAPPLLSCWPVVTEAAWLLRKNPQALQQLFAALQTDLIKLIPIGADIAPWLSDVFKQYADQEPQLADACLVYLAETGGLDTVFTLDRRDFAVYRLNRRQALQVLP